MSFIEIICHQLIILWQEIKNIASRINGNLTILKSILEMALIGNDVMAQRMIFVWYFHKIVWIWKMNCNCCIINYRAKTISISTIQLLLLSIVLSFLPIKWQMVTSRININYSLVSLIPIACVFGTFHL